MLGKHRCGSANFKQTQPFHEAKATDKTDDFPARSSSVGLKRVQLCENMLLRHCSSLTVSHSFILTGNFGASQRRRGCDRGWRVCVCPGEERLREGWPLDS